MPIPLTVTSKSDSAQTTFANAAEAENLLRAMMSNNKDNANLILNKIIGNATPRNVHDFVHSFSEANQKLLCDSVVDPNAPNAPSGPTGAVVGSVSDLIKILEGNSTEAKALRLFLATNGTVEGTFLPQQIEVNPSVGLNLLLANPMVAAVVMEQRKRQSELAYARVAQPANIFGMPIPFNGHQVSVQLMRGGNQDNLNPEFPIEMRGSGYAIAHMRGGQFPLMLGTLGSPTSWRPVSDSSFISASLKAALASLEQSLKSKKSDLQQDTKTQITGLITALEAAEKAVKDKRDQLNNYNNAIAAGNTRNIEDRKGDSAIKTEEITATVEAYNNAMKSRQKIENKLFRVVIALGGKVQSVY